MSSRSIVEHYTNRHRVLENSLRLARNSHANTDYIDDLEGQAASAYRQMKAAELERSFNEKTHHSNSFLRSGGELGVTAVGAMSGSWIGLAFCLFVGLCLFTLILVIFLAPAELVFHFIGAEDCFNVSLNSGWAWLGSTFFWVFSGGTLIYFLKDR